MSARDVLADTTIGDDGAWLGYYGADAVLSTLRAMPEPDRLALARELAGPGYAVVPVVLSKRMRLAGVAEKKRGHTMPQIWRAVMAAHFAEEDRDIVKQHTRAAAQEPTP